MKLNRSKSLFIMLTTVAILFFNLAGCFNATNGGGIVPTSIPSTTDNATLPKIKEGFLSVKLLDAFTGEPICNVDVKIMSDNGIRCIRAPCPTDAQEWNGKSDDNGLILVPLKILNVITTITATGYKTGGDLNEDSEKITDSYRQIDLRSG